MEVRRINPEGGVVREIVDLRKRVKSQETRATGNVVIRETLKTTDPETGVATIVGQLSDGSYGIQPYVYDITPPPVASRPIVASVPGVISVTWDGQFVNGELAPRDFTRLNIIGHKMDGSATVSSFVIGEILNASNIVYISPDVIPVGETWTFSFEAEDYNTNRAAWSDRSLPVTMESVVADAGINAALEAVNEATEAAQITANDAQTAANTAQDAADEAAAAAIEASSLAASKGTVYTQSTTPAPDLSGLWIDTGHNNIPRRYVGKRTALAVNIGGGANTYSRLTVLGWNVTTVTSIPALEEAAKYDVVIFDAGYAGLLSSAASMVAQLFNRGVSVFTSGNDTTNLSPLFTGATNRGTPKNPIRPTGATAPSLGWTEYNDSDLNLYLTGVNASARVTGVTLVGAVDQPLNLVMEHATNFARWVHIQTYGTPAAVVDAHLNWLSDNWVAIQDQTVLADIIAANNLAAGKNKAHYNVNQPSTTGNTVGDMWFDIDDSYALYTWSGSAWVKTQDTQEALDLASTKIRSFVQASQPTATSVGDIWMDTDNKNEMFRWSGSAWVSYRDLSIADADAKAATAIADAATAKDIADGKVATYFQTGQPTGQVAGDIGDLWFDTDDGNKMYRWTGSAWVVADDQRIASAVTAAADARTIADSKITTFYQDTAPSSTGRTAGDLWVDTDDQNKLYRWNGVSWDSARDLSIASAANSAASALEAAQAAQTAAETAQAVADGAIRTFYQADAPTGLNNTTNIGDLWFDTDTDQAYRWNGTVWTLIQDNAIGAALQAAQNAQTTADGKITSYYQPGQPATGEVGDLWFDTDDKNRPYYCSSISPLTWTAVRDGAIADAQSTANTALTSANGKNKTYYQTAKPTGGTYILGDTWVDTDDGNKLYVHNGTDFVSAQDGAIGAAASLAASKGKTLIQSTEPSVADQLVQNLWIDTTNGANTPKRWNGSIWVAITDKVATDAAMAAVNAQTKADTAFNNAAAAATAAGNAQTTADGKNRVWYQTAAPAGTAHKDGDLWFDTDDGNKLYLWKAGTTNAWTVFQDAAIGIAQTAANNAATAASNAQTTANNAQTAAATADSKAVTAKSVADQAVTDAATAQSDADQALADALAANNLAISKGKVLYQTTAPTGDDANTQTLWIDITGGANTPKRWVSGTTWATVTDKVATDAASLASSKGKVLYQTTAPTGIDANAQTLWIDTTNGANTPKRWVSGTTWTAVTDKVATDAASLAATKGKILFQTTAPTGADASALTLWIDTTNGANTPKRWVSGTTWAAITDKVALDAATAAANAATAASNAQGTANTAVTNAENAQTLAQQAFDNAASASAAAGNAQTTADAKNRVWYQDDAPAGTGHKTNDIWFDTNDGNKPHRWTGSAWVVAQDAAIATAQAKADAAFSTSNGKNTNYYQPAQPSGGTYILGDLWFDTDNNYKLYTYTGSIWQGTQDAAAAQAAAITAAATDATTKATNAQNAAIQAAALDATQKADAAKAVAMTAAANAENRVVNGSFELDFDGWTKSNNTHTIDTTVARTGTKSYVTQGSGEITQPGFPVVEGSTWRYEWFYKTEASFVAGSAGGLRLQKSTDGGVTFSDAVSASITVSADWKYQSVEFVVPAGVTHLRARVAYAYVSGPKVWMDDIRLTDVTSIKTLETYAETKASEAEAAAIQAAATDATSKANTAKAEAIAAAGTDASTKAATAKSEAITAAATDAATKAATAKSEAIAAAATDASTKATNAQTAAATDATTKMETAQRIAIDANGYSKNPSFEDWTGTFPVGFSAFSAAPTKETSTVLTGKNAMRFNLTDATTQSGVTSSSILSHAPNLQYFTVELDVRLDSGSSFGGSGVLIDWAGMTGGNRATISLATEIPTPTVGKWYRLTKVIQRPATATGTHTGYNVWLMGQYSSGLGTQAIKNIVFDWFNIRPSTTEEITSFGLPATVTTLTNTVNTKTRTYFQGTSPSLTGNTTGDLWFDTANGNKPYVWNGAWTSTQDASIATAQTAATNAQTAANGKNKVVWSTSAASGTTGYSAGDIWFQRDAAGTVLAQWEFTTSWQARPLNEQIIPNLTAGKITAGTFSGDRIGVNSIDASKLTIGDFTNLMDDPDFELGAGWSSSPQAQVLNITVGVEGQPTKALRITGNGTTTDVTNKNVIPVLGGDKFYGSIHVKSDGVATVGDVHFSTTVTLADGTLAYPAFEQKTANNIGSSWSTLKGVVTMPANAVSMRVRISVRNNVTTGNFYFDHAIVRRQSTAVTIADGTITAGSLIVANGAIGNAQIADLNADKITAGTIATARLDAASIRSKLIEADFLVATDIFAPSSITSASGIFGVMDASVINAGTIAAARLDAEVVKSKLIDASYIVATDIFAPNSITSASGIFGTMDASVINAGLIGADRLDANTIRAKLIAADYLVATDIFAPNSITSASGIFGVMDASVINAGTIAADRLDAETVRAKIIAATDINAVDIIAQNSITATNGLIASLDASKITVGTLAAARIGAKSIGVDKLLVQSSDNLIVEADFGGSGASWDLPAGIVINATAGRNSLPAMVITNSAALQTSFNVAGVPKVAIESISDETNAYRVSMWVKSSVTAPANGVLLNARFRSTTGTYTTQSVTYTTGTPPVAATFAANTWVEITGVVTAPANTISVAFSVSTAAAFSTGVVTIDQVMVARAATGELIVDGAVTATKIAANSITATNGIIQSIDAAKITVGEMSGARLAAKSILADRLVISSTDNLIVEAAFEHPTSPGSSWTTGANQIIQPTGGRGGAAALRVTGTISPVTTFNLSNKVQVDDDSRFRVSMWLKTNALFDAGNIVLGVRTYAGTGLGADVVLFSNTASTDIDGYVPGTDVWTQIEGVSLPLPSGTTAVEFFIKTTAPSTAAYVDIDSVSVTRAAEGKLIVDGSITASKLETDLVLATRIVAGDADGTHAEMSPQGFRVYADAIEPGAPSTEVVRLGVSSTNDYFAITKADGAMAAAISQDGVGSFSAVNAIDSLVYRGNELQSLIDVRGTGVVAAAYRTTNPTVNATVGGGWVPYLRLEVTMLPGRLYKIWTSPVRLDTTGDAGCTLALGFSTTAIATTANAIIFTQAYKKGAGRQSVTLQEFFAIQESVPTTVSIIMFFGVQEGTTGVGAIRADLYTPVRLTVEDMGTPAGVANGTHLDSAVTPPAPKNTYVTQFAANNMRSYDGSNNWYQFNTSQLHQGLSPAGYGNLKGIATFPDMTASLSGATINYIRVYFKFNHWYYNSGGTARIGLHTHSAVPGTFSQSGTVVSSSGWPKPGARWVDIPSEHWANFKNGTYKGVSLEGDGTYGTYGYADAPTIEISYTK